jgi:hypothetical protein
MIWMPAVIAAAYLGGDSAYRQSSTDAKTPSGRKSEERECKKPQRVSPGTSPGLLPWCLGAELLAATLAAGAKHLTATHGRLAGEKAMPPGADEVARLESALHRRKS